MRLTVHLESYALCGSGEGAGLIDSDIVHDRHGVPYLPGKRMKGLLRESALEVTELLGMDSPALVAHVFGDGGFQPGIVRVPNLYPQGYDAAWATALQKLLHAKGNTLVTPASILTEYTAIRQQTAIEHGTGVARDASLRIVRMLKPGLVFEGDLTLTDPNSPVLALLRLAARNLRRFGTRRNRGQGTIACVFSPATAWSVQDAIEEVLTWSAPAIPESPAARSPIPAENGAPARLTMTIRTLSPVVLAMQSGDQNTVSTAPFIPGSTVKGILVERVRKALGLQKGMETESGLFRALFLEQGENSLFASPAFPVIDEAVYTPAPLHLHRDKVHPERLHNLLASRPHNTKPVHGLVSLATEGFLGKEPDTTLFFHTQRAQDRKQGRSTEDDGAIFYYEAIEKGQEFRATLRGPRGLLDLILSPGTTFSASIGRSRSAQYGRVEVTLTSPAHDDEDDDEKDLCSNGQTLLTCLSPLIVRNAFGFPEAAAKNLEACLAEALGEAGVAVTVVSSHARTMTVEPFIGVLGCWLPGCEAFREGSSFVLAVSGVSYNVLSRSLKKVACTGLGEWCAMGFGTVEFSEPPTNPSYSARSDARTAPTLADIGRVPSGLEGILTRIVTREEEAFLAEQGMRDAREYSARPKERLNNHQIGRMETFVAGAGDVRRLQATLGELRHSAKNKLQACRNNARMSIYEALTSFTGPIQEHLDRFRTDHDKLLKVAGIAHPTVEDRFRLAKCYWLALLRRLRKLNKEAKLS